MNILIAADYRAPQSGNFIASLIALGRKLQKNGSHVVYVFPSERNWINWIRNEQFEVVITGEQALLAENQFPVLCTLLETYQIDLVHTHFGMFHHALIHNRKNMQSIKIVIHDHMDFSVNSKVAIQYLRSIAHSIVYAANNINVISVMRRKNQSYVFLKRKWFIPNGLSMERYIDKSMTRKECRESLGVRDTDIVCLLLGWDLKRKGFDVALKAVYECRKRNPNIILGIIGAGKGVPSDSAKSFIKNHTSFNPDEPWIRYFDNYEDMFAVHRAIDVYISASRMEAFSYGLLEAISQETPVVVSDIPGTNWASMYSNSYFYSVEDFQMCSDAIMDAVHIGRVSTNAKDVVRQYGIDKWCDEVLSVYNVVMD